MKGLAYAATSVLLRYPGEDVLSVVDDAEAALPLVRDKRVRRPLGEFTGWLRRAGAATAAEHYVSTFDLRRRCCLHLSYYRHGDTRARGMALLSLKQAYRDAGHEPPEDELPDYLPLMLEFAAAEPAEGTRLLVQCQAGLELLRRGLEECESPYRHVVGAVCATLPSPGRHQRATIERLAVEGPPDEQVGLEPFPPAEVTMGATR